MVPVYYVILDHCCHKKHFTSTDSLCEFSASTKKQYSSLHVLILLPVIFLCVDIYLSFNILVET